MKQMIGSITRSVCVCVLLICAVSCASSQGRFSPLGQTFPPKAEGFEVQVFRDAPPQQSHLRISRLDVHLERTQFISPSFEDALPELKQQARLSGADAIIEIEEHRSSIGETRIYHVTATGIRFTSPADTH